MGVILGVIEYLVGVAVLGMVLYARGLYLELKKTKEKLQIAQETIEDLAEELEEVYSYTEDQKKEGDAICGNYHH